MTICKRENSDIDMSLYTRTYPIKIWFFTRSSCFLVIHAVQTSQNAFHSLTVFFIFENVGRLSYKSMIKDLATVNLFLFFCLCYDTLISFLLGYVMLSQVKLFPSFCLCYNILTSFWLYYIILGPH